MMIIFLFAWLFIYLSFDQWSNTSTKHHVGYTTGFDWQMKGFVRSDRTAVSIVLWERERCPYWEVTTAFHLFTSHATEIGPAHQHALCFGNSSTQHGMPHSAGPANHRLSPRSGRGSAGVWPWVCQRGLAWSSWNEWGSRRYRSVTGMDQVPGHTSPIVHKTVVSESMYECFSNILDLYPCESSLPIRSLFCDDTCKAHVCSSESCFWVYYKEQCYKTCDNVVLLGK